MSMILIQAITLTPSQDIWWGSSLIWAIKKLRWSAPAPAVPFVLVLILLRQFLSRVQPSLSLICPFTSVPGVSLMPESSLYFFAPVFFNSYLCLLKIFSNWYYICCAWNNQIIIVRPISFPVISCLKLIEFYSVTLWKMDTIYCKPQFRFGVSSMVAFLLDILKFYKLLKDVTFDLRSCKLHNLEKKVLIVEFQAAFKSTIKLPKVELQN